jgi:phosphonate transport system ATP-binding protein
MIRLENIGVRYPGNVEALCPTTLEFSRGTFTVILGVSGAGKSTLLRCLNMLTTPSTGTIEVEGVGEITTNRGLLQKHRLKTGMIFQHHQLIGRHTALKNVLVGRIGHYGTFRSFLPLAAQDQELALDCLHRVGLLDLALQRVDSLSGGQQQRVGVARALAQKPQIILADEPIASLDPCTSDDILSLLYRVTKEDRLTTIVSLHQVEFAKEYGDRVIGLANGRLVFDGTAKDLEARNLERIYGEQNQKTDLAA